MVILLFIMTVHVTVLGYAVLIIAFPTLKTQTSIKTFTKLKKKSRDGSE